MITDNKRIKFLNTYIDNLNINEVLIKIDEMVNDGLPHYIVTPNVDHIVKLENDTEFKKVYEHADLILADGMTLIWISKLYGKPIKEKISGSDLVPEVCRIAAERGYSIFILGGKARIAEKAKTNLENTYTGIRIVGTYSPKFGFEQDYEELNKINHLIRITKPNILLACLGCPRQEKFIYENCDKYQANVSICAGATVDFLAGNIKRAPKWMSDAGFEWFYRFLQEPKRLFKRYFVDDIKIVKVAFKYRKRMDRLS